MDKSAWIQRKEGELAVKCWLRFSPKIAFLIHVQRSVQKSPQTKHWYPFNVSRLIFSKAHRKQKCISWKKKQKKNTHTHSCAWGDKVVDCLYCNISLRGEWQSSTMWSIDMLPFTELKTFKANKFRKTWSVYLFVASAHLTIVPPSKWVSS